MYSVVIPCFNEEKNLEKLAERFDRINRQLKKENKQLELVLVNNGSTDNSQNIIESIIEKREYVRSVRVEKNQGYGYGILRGLESCKGEYLFWLHADMQLPPEAIIDMIHILDKLHNPENVFIRGRRKKRPLLDRFFTFGMSIYESIYLGKALYDINGQPTCISRRMYNKWTYPPHDFSLDLYAYYMSKVMNATIIKVKVVQTERVEGESSWNTGMASRMKLVRRTLTYSKKLKKDCRRMKKKR